MKTGIELIADERRRQIKEEGWTAEHDEGHEPEDLAAAGAAYAKSMATGQISYGSCGWPWEPMWWKPKGGLSDLVRAGALIAAAIDRLQAE